MWGWLEKRAGVRRELFTFKGFFFLFFSPVITTCSDHSQKESMQRGCCLLCNSKKVHTSPWVKKSCDLKQPNIWFFMFVDQALCPFPTLCSDPTLLSDCKVSFLSYLTSPLSLDYRSCLSAYFYFLALLPFCPLVVWCIFVLGENAITSSSGTKWAHVCASQGDQPKRLGVNKGLIQNIMVSEIILVGFYPTRRAWLFQEALLWHFLLACVFVQTCFVPGPVFTPLPWHVLAFAEICHLQCLSKDTCTD